MIQTRARNSSPTMTPNRRATYRAEGSFRFDLEKEPWKRSPTADLPEEGDNDLIKRAARSTPRSAPTAGTWRSRPVGNSSRRTPTKIIDVYVRDMDIPSGQPGALELVSALDGGVDRRRPTAPPEPIPGGEPGPGSSREFRYRPMEKVVFKTDAPSDLTAGLNPGCSPRGSCSSVTAWRRPQTHTGENETREQGEMTTTPAGGALGGGDQRGRDDGRLDRSQRVREDALPGRGEPGPERSHDLGGGSPTGRRRRPGGHGPF